MRVSSETLWTGEMTCGAFSQFQVLAIAFARNNDYTLFLEARAAS
ncbi:hypothetical protein LMG28688_07002 [Paraburkholderia caffeinitolerans]|uniref:Uncharacterized protein n=1 Tax=Paraburkholderia caffeinitolerans TaxID=1723730 RepID=A0A6J5H1F2_9BURK|nr:hypothetical protein LMG28688_07002 [Paraburkholderia caffeinitolerans]